MCIITVPSLVRVFIISHFHYLRTSFTELQTAHTHVLTNLEAAQKPLEFVNTGYLRALDVLPASLIHGLESNPPQHCPRLALVILQRRSLPKGMPGLSRVSNLYERSASQRGLS